MRQLITIAGFAATTAAATLAVCWPGRTYADPPETFFEQGAVDDITFDGEVTSDRSFKNGWAIKVTYENRGDEDETCTIDTELTRAQINPGSRSSPPGIAVWHHKDKVTVVAHESVVKNYEVPRGWPCSSRRTRRQRSSVRRRSTARTTSPIRTTRCRCAPTRCTR